MDLTFQLRPSARKFTSREFLRQVGSHIYRWRRVKISLLDPDDLAIETLETPAQALESLELCVLQDQSTKVVNLFSGDAPSLERIELQRIAVRDWGSPIFTGLRSLVIYMPSVVYPSLQQLVGILQRCPLLQVLKLTEFCGHGSSELDPDAERSSLVLQRLSDLELRGLPPATLESILSRLDIPQRFSVALTCHYPHPLTSIRKKYPSRSGLSRLYSRP